MERIQRLVVVLVLCVLIPTNAFAQSMPCEIAMEVNLPCMGVLLPDEDAKAGLSCLKVDLPEMIDRCVDAVVDLPRREIEARPGELLLELRPRVRGIVGDHAQGQTVAADLLYEVHSPGHGRVALVHHQRALDVQ